MDENSNLIKYGDVISSENDIQNDNIEEIKMIQHDLPQFDTHVAVLQEIIEFIQIIGILIIMRPRRWPEHFESTMIRGYLPN